VATALVLGGTGQVGLAVAARLLPDGWEVRLASRGRTEPTATVPEGARTVVLDRDDDAAVGSAADEVDLLVDAVCMTTAHARQLVDLGDRVGALHVVSTLAVYADAAARSLESAAETGFPQFPVPIGEDQPTVGPGDMGYADRKVAVEQEVLAHARVPVTVSRPGAIHGLGSVHPREWFFVSRALAGRRAVLLDHRGASRFQPTAAANLAEIIALGAAHPGRRIVNAADPDCPTTLEIGRFVAAALDASWTEVLLTGSGPDGVGETPWSTPAPFVASTALAERELGYAPVTTYADAVPAVVQWLVEATRDRDPVEVFPFLGRHYRPQVEVFSAEDAVLRALTGD